MIHSVAPQRSDVPAMPSNADPPSQPRDPQGEHPPGPISWELDVPDEGADVAPGPIERDPLPTTGWADRRQPTPHRGAAVPEDAAPEETAVPAPTITAHRPTPYLRDEVEDEEVAVSPRLATGVHSLGPVGRRRSVILSAVIAVCTLGLHPVLWVRRANREMSQFDPRMCVRPARSASAIAVAVLLPLLAAAAEGARIVADRLGSAPDLPLSNELTRWLLLAPAIAPLLVVLLPFSVVAASMTLERVRVVEDRAGVDPEHQIRPAAGVWWAAIPVVGLAVLVVMGQRRLNRVWSLCA